MPDVHSLGRALICFKFHFGFARYCSHGLRVFSELRLVAHVGFVLGWSSFQLVEVKTWSSGLTWGSVCLQRGNPCRLCHKSHNPQDTSFPISVPGEQPC